VLADAALANPTLHAAAGVPNREGLSDATLYGASPERVACTPEGETFLLLTSGTPVADPGAVARDARWHRIVSGVGEAGATLALYLHADDSAAAAFLGSASDIVVLAHAHEATPPVLRDLEPLVRAVAGPSVGTAEGATPPAPSVAEGADAPVPEASGAGRFGRVGALLALAVIVAAVLGYLLVSGLG
jgi:hypothetical protein